MKVINIEGQIFNHFKALDEYYGINGKTYWKFLCTNCNNIVFRSKDNVKRGKIKHCGCLTSKNRSLLMSKDITNQRFTRLVAIKYVENRNKRQYWLFKCDCGKEKIIDKNSVMHGDARSCGCYLKEKTSELRDLNFLGEGVSSFNRLYLLYKKGAEKRNVEFKLTKDDVKKYSIENCFYCNQIPYKIMKTHSATGHYVYNGIDRQDNNKGYYLDNCVSCCTECNLAKKNLTLEKFYDWIEKLYKNLNKKGLVK